MSDSRIVRVETVIEHIEYMLSRMDKRFDKSEESLNDGLDKIDKKLDRLDVKIDSNFKWIVGTIISLFILNGILPAISKLLIK